jgi:hypothetical protein
MTPTLGLGQLADGVDDVDQGAGGILGHAGLDLAAVQADLATASWNFFVPLVAAANFCTMALTAVAASRAARPG